MKLSDVLVNVPGVNVWGNPEENIGGISYSSKTVQPGDLFVALKGEKADGNDFIGEAVDRGAIAVLSERKRPDHFQKTWIEVCNPGLLSLSARPIFMPTLRNNSK